MKLKQRKILVLSFLLLFILTGCGLAKNAERVAETYMKAMVNNDKSKVFGLSYFSKQGQIGESEKEAMIKTEVDKYKNSSFDKFKASISYVSDMEATVHVQLSHKKGGEIGSKTFYLVKVDNKWFVDFDKTFATS